MHQSRISEVTRRSIIDALVVGKVNWSGRFEEQNFLARLYDLSQMPSQDRRFSNASDDIWQHRVMNRDWADDWVFKDSRFNLISAPDEEFLRFLCEILHPVVQPDSNEVQRILNLINEHLEIDGWKLCEQLKIAGRPVYAAASLLLSDRHSVAAAKIVAESIDTDYVSRQVIRMHAALAGEPDVAIGTAKEFVETVCKTILKTRHVPYAPDEKMPRLVKQVAAQLDLVPQDLDREASATETIKRLLSNLSACLTELRN